jgi:hypothetical protein
MLCLDICSFPFKHVFVVFVFYFSTKKKREGEKGSRFLLFPYIASQISYVYLTDVSVLDALIIFAFI